ncbi:MAG: hypothetical protein OXC48_10305 [Endozoicomonadaceae bacterium]|nr:hypothetical protein [Endozoicomonadaceae bacterium]
MSKFDKIANDLLQEAKDRGWKQASMQRHDDYYPGLTHQENDS